MTHQFALIPTDATVPCMCCNTPCNTQDGRICEAVVWHLPQGTRHSVSDTIVRHVLERHMPPDMTILAHTDALDGVLHSAALPREQVAAARQLLDAAFDRLRQGLMAYVLYNAHNDHLSTDSQAGR